MAFKDDVLKLAIRRAQKGAAVLEAARELLHAGQLGTEDFLHIQSSVQAGYAYAAAETLERLLAVEMIRSGGETCDNMQFTIAQNANGGEPS